LPCHYVLFNKAENKGLVRLFYCLLIPVASSQIMIILLKLPLHYGKSRLIP
jgi:hypothetical protein